MLMIKDGDSRAIIHEMDIVYMWVGVSDRLGGAVAHTKRGGELVILKLN